MFKFKKEQKIFELCGVKIGGQPGELPTVMIGSIFYDKHKIIKNAKKGEFEKGAAEKLLERERELSEKTGNPRIVDICCAWPDAFGKLISFISDKSEGPFIIDGTTADVKIAGVKYVHEVGLSRRAIYNSITPHTKENEISAIKDAGIKSAILLTLNTKNPTISGRLEVLGKLLKLAEEAGIENIMIDATVIDIPDPGPVSKTIYYVKENYGLPAGAGTHNSIARWISCNKLNPKQHLMASCVANIFPIFAGGNFILYGPIEHAPTAYFCCGLADAFVAYNKVNEYREQPLTKNHPLFRIFKSPPT